MSEPFNIHYDQIPHFKIILNTLFARHNIDDSGPVVDEESGQRLTRYTREDYIVMEVITNVYTEDPNNLFIDLCTYGVSNAEHYFMKELIRDVSKKSFGRFELLKGTRRKDQYGEHHGIYTCKEVIQPLTEAAPPAARELTEVDKHMLDTPEIGF